MICQAIKYRRLSALLFLLVITLLTNSAGAQTEEFGRSLKVEYRQTSSHPLPFQAVRLQTVWRNVGKKTLNIKILPDRAFQIAYVTPAEGLVKSRPRGSLIIWPRNNTSHTHLDYKNTITSPFRPGEELSASFAIAAYWKSFEYLHSFFPKEGRYVSRVKVYDYKSPPILIQIYEPKGNDYEIYRMLLEDKKLAGAMLCPSAVPHPDTIPKIKEIIRRFPKSSYTDYAHYALGRRIFKGDLDTTSHPLKKLPYKQRMEAIAHLKKINFKRFAYAPLALGMLRKLLVATYNNREAKKIALQLDTDYEDAFFRLLDLAHRLTREEWKKLNPRKPHKPRNKSRKKK